MAELIKELYAEDPSEAYVRIRGLSTVILSSPDINTFKRTFKQLWYFGLRVGHCDSESNDFDFPNQSNSTAAHKSYIVSVNSLMCLNNLVKEVLSQASSMEESSELPPYSHKNLLDSIWLETNEFPWGSSWKEFAVFSSKFPKPPKDSAVDFSGMELYEASVIRLVSHLVRLGHIIIDGSEGSPVCNELQLSHVIQGMHKMSESFIDSSLVLLHQTTVGHRHGNGEQCLSGYLQHKILALVLRIQRQERIGLQWIQSATDFFNKNNFFFQETADSIQAGIPNNDMLSSPFYAALSASQSAPSAVTNMTATPSVQRRVILILLRCVTAPAANVKSSNDINFKACLHESKRQAGNCFLSGLAGLLHSNYPAASSSESVMDDKELLGCRFIELLQGEDGLLFEILLEMVQFWVYMSHPCSVERNGNQRNMELESKSEYLTALSPVCLFQRFLQSIQYDDSLLLDFLISNEVGALCLEYLMKVLPLVVECPTVSNRKNKKGRMADAEMLNDFVLSCLSTLEATISRLHKRNLFPYNPSPLLRRLRGLNAKSDGLD